MRNDIKVGNLYRRSLTPSISSKRNGPWVYVFVTYVVNVSYFDCLVFEDGKVTPVRVGTLANDWELISEL